MIFLLRLCMALGMTLGRLKEEMTTAEVRLWMAFSCIEPIGEARADARTAMACTLYANSVRGKNSQKAKVTDFLPFAEVKSKESKRKSVANKVRAMFGKHNG